MWLGSDYVFAIYYICTEDIIHHSWNAFAELTGNVDSTFCWLILMFEYTLMTD